MKPWATIPWISGRRLGIYVQPAPRIIKPLLMARRNEYDMIAVVHPLFKECLQGITDKTPVGELFGNIELEYYPYMKEDKSRHLIYKQNILKLLRERKMDGINLSSAKRILFEDNIGKKYYKLTHILKDEGLVDEVVFTDNSRIDDINVNEKLNNFNSAVVVGTYTEGCVSEISRQLRKMRIKTKILPQYVWP